MKPTIAWREYHEATKHTPDSIRRSRHTLDWANMPNPFRHYEGVPLLDLPADPRSPAIPTFDVLRDQRGTAAGTSGAAFLSQLLFYSAAISASKLVPHTGAKYALRVNPSSGNLHPTEFHFFTRGLQQWPDGLYHYRPSSHMTEQRALGDFQFDAPLVFVLTSIAWREAWKYRDRAYRYCLHDMGHAWQSLILAATALGCETSATGHFVDNDIARLCRLADDEWPMLLISLRGAALPLREPDDSVPVWFGGAANSLSTETISYSLIHRIHAATCIQQKDSIQSAEPAPSGYGNVHLPEPSLSDRPFGAVVRSRRSALDFEGGPWSITLADLSALLAAAAAPLHADFADQRYIQLYVYVHRVEGLEPGVYRHWPHRGELELILEGDQRVAAAGLSLGQDLAGNSCVTFSMVADLDRAARAHGDRAYRYVHFEAGAIGHRLYLAAEALGVRATGIGAFFDDSVHQYLRIDKEREQVVYHFAIGHPIHDARIEATE
jgi:SagB-type dehydrogenase family enzyme